MWQRFTERARKTVYFAQEEANQRNCAIVGPEHLLLGLLRNKDSVAVQVLQSIPIEVNQVEAFLIDSMFPVMPNGLASDFTLSPSAKIAIEFAYVEAKSMANEFIGTEHLLLGILHEGKGLGADAIRNPGISIEQLRATSIAIQEENRARRV